jgi:hypothetical protein
MDHFVGEEIVDFGAINGDAKNQLRLETLPEPNDSEQCREVNATATASSWILGSRCFLFCGSTPIFEEPRSRYYKLLNN